MPETAKFYELSIAADQDIEDIFDHTSKDYGFKQAEQYLCQLEVLFEQLCTHPRLGRKRNEIRTGLRSIPCKQHIIYYRILKDRIRIVRVLRGNCDQLNFL